MAKRSAQGTGSIRKKTVIRKEKEYTYWEARYTEGIDPGTGKESTQASYKGHIKNHIKPALGAIKLEALDAHTIQGFYNQLGKVENQKEKLAGKSAKNIHGVLHKALKQAVMIGYIRFNPTDACILPRITRKELKPLDEEQTKSFLQAIKGHRYETLFSFALFTGLREGEVLGLQWSCVNLEQGTVLIEKQLQREKKKNGQYIFAPLKNDKTRTIAIAPWVIHVLRTQKAWQDEQHARIGDLWEESGLVFTNQRGGHLAIHTVYKDFKKVVISIGCPTIRFHDLRHSYAVASIRSGDDIKTVQGNLGHATASFTLDVYGHVTDQMKKASAARMETYITGVLNL